MAIVQCVKGHYYDDSKESSCPYCEKLVDHKPEDLFREQVTSYLDPDLMNDSEPVTQSYGDDVEEDDKTISIFSDDFLNRLTAGWLVSRSGVTRGKSYPFFVGRNFVGRSPDMDIILTEDDHISRDTHFSLVFDPKTVSFYLLPGSGVVYLNEKPITEAAQITEGDELRAGEMSFIFVPFCKEGRDWN